MGTLWHHWMLIHDMCCKCVSALERPTLANQYCRNVVTVWGQLLIVNTQALEIDTVAVVCQFGSVKSVPLPAAYYICSLLSMLPISLFPYPMLNQPVIIIIHYLSKACVSHCVLRPILPCGFVDADVILQMVQEKPNLRAISPALPCINSESTCEATTQLHTITYEYLISLHLSDEPICKHLSKM